VTYYIIEITKNILVFRRKMQTNTRVKMVYRESRLAGQRKLRRGICWETTTTEQVVKGAR